MKDGHDVSDEARDDEGKFAAAGGKTAADRGIWHYVNSLAEMMPHEPFYKHLVEHGKFYQPQALPPEHKYGPMKACFENTLDDHIRKGHPYVEGFVDSGIDFPIHHAWSYDKNGVVDRTIRTRDDEKRRRTRNVEGRTVADDTVQNPEKMSYFGWEPPHRMVSQAALHHGTYGMFLKGPFPGWPYPKREGTK